MVSRADRDVGRLLALLRELGLDDRTIVFFCSDNGGTMDVGGADTPFFRSNGPWRATKGDLYEGGIRVPMIARWPGHVPAGRTTDTPAAAYDIMRTVLSLAGLDSGAAATWSLDGVDLTPVLRGTGTVARDHLLWEFTGYGAQQAVRKGDWKGVRRAMGKGNMRLELYNLAEDPGETRDVSADHPALVREIEGIMRADRTPSTEFPLPGVDIPATSAP
jgi:arylsulfatase